MKITATHRAYLHDQQVGIARVVRVERIPLSHVQLDVMRLPDDALDEIEQKDDRYQDPKEVPGHKDKGEGPLVEYRALAAEEVEGGRACALDYGGELWGVRGGGLG